MFLNPLSSQNPELREQLGYFTVLRFRGVDPSLDDLIFVARCVDFIFCRTPHNDVLIVWQSTGGDDDYIFSINEEYSEKLQEALLILSRTDREYLRERMEVLGTTGFGGIGADGRIEL